MPSSFPSAIAVLYSDEIRSVVLIICGDKVHRYYFGKKAYEAMIKDSKYTDNKELLTLPNAVHTDFYDNLMVILFDKIEEFFKKYLQ